MTDAVEELQRDLRARLHAVADPERAPRMQAYMKSAMPYYGVAAPVQKVQFREAFAAHELTDRAEFERAVLLIWDEAKHREERYAAIALARHRAYRTWRDAASLPLYDHLIVTGAWWDYVDVIASRLVGDALGADPSVVAPVMRRWAVDDDMWRRRSAILSQLSFGAETDRALLLDCIGPSMSSKEFFLRKAIGWALRQFAYADPDWVGAFVATHREQMSGLTIREATKHLSL